jgi:replicative DNA helicase
VTIYGTRETLDEAIHVFHLDRDGFPELVPLGLPKLDGELGGLGPGACGIMAAATGVGKSSTMLAAMLNSKVKVGAVSVEDGADLVGARILSGLTGIDSLRIRRKALSEAELAAIAKAAKGSKLDHMFFSYPIAGHISRVCEDITEMCKRGCKLIWLDYLQEVQGDKTERRHEVKEVMSKAHAAAAEGGAALMCLSQFRRLGDIDKRPEIYHLKESGDLENKARIIILAHRVKDPEGKARIRFRLAKSAYGGEHITWDMVRGKSGMLEDTAFYDDMAGDF